MPSVEIISKPDMGKARNRALAPKVSYDDCQVSERVSAFAQGRTYLVKTFGCQGNVRDEEVISGYLERCGFSKAKDESKANIVIINTCAVRENAEDKVYGEIGKFKANYLADKDFILCVCGCMMQEEGKAERLFESYRHLKIVFGTHNIPSLPSLLDRYLQTRKPILDVISYPGDIIEGLPSIRLDPYKAYVNISYGCDKFCTYCIVPYTRGRERSRPLKEIVKECEQLVEEGYKEITLLGQNVNSYGKDLGDGTTFSTVLEAVAKTGIARLRFTTSHPWDFDLEMLDVIAKYPNIMNCIHLPVQSGSSEILRLMGRRYDRESYLKLVEEIRKRIPGCAITTDIIVGFPNETESQFEETLSLCEKVKYDAAFTFIYSPRAGTPAAKMEDNVSDKVKHERFNRLLKVIEDGVCYHSSQMVGKVYDVLVDGQSKKDEAFLSGYAENGKLIHFQGPSYLRGLIVPVKVTEDHAFSMKGVLEGDPFDFALAQAKRSLESESEYAEFLKAKAELDADQSFSCLYSLFKSKREQLQKAAKNGEQNEKIQEIKGELREYADKLKNHPLYVNFLSRKADVEALLEEAFALIK